MLRESFIICKKHEKENKKIMFDTGIFKFVIYYKRIKDLFMLFQLISEFQAVGVFTNAKFQLYCTLLTMYC